LCPLQGFQALQKLPLLFDLEFDRHGPYEVVEELPHNRSVSPIRRALKNVVRQIGEALLDVLNLLARLTPGGLVAQASAAAYAAKLVADLGPPEEGQP
jgi:hypothetical protein